MAKQYEIICRADIPAWIIKTSPKSFDSWDTVRQLEYAQMRKDKGLANAKRYAAVNKEEYTKKHRVNNATYRVRHREKLNVKKRKQAKERYYLDLDNSRKKSLEYRNNNLDKCRERDRRSYAKRKKENPALCAEKREKLIKANPSLKIRFSLSVRLNNLLKKKGLNKDESSFVDFVGCSINELKNHIEAQFSKKMNWDNWGKVWHVDHIIPCASFDHSIHSQVLQCWHFSNLQPLIAKENLSKSSKITHPQLSLRLPVS
jgi:hypothetical protein